MALVLASDTLTLVDSDLPVLVRRLQGSHPTLTSCLQGSCRDFQFDQRNPLIRADDRLKLASA